MKSITRVPIVGDPQGDKELVVSLFDLQQPFDLGEDQFLGDDCDWEIGFFKSIVDASPNYVEALAHLGHLYTRRGDYHRGLEIDKHLVRLRPDDPTVYYNLACSLSLTGQLDAALVQLQKAIERGYTDYSYMFDDEDLESVRNDPRFFDLMARFNKPV